MLNQVILIGRTTRDIELKESSSGRTYGVMRIAVARSFKNQGTGNYDTDFIDVTIWGRIAENVAKYAGKGSAVSVRGRIGHRMVDTPGQQTFKTLTIIGEQVSFIQTKAPGTNGDIDEDLDTLLLDDFSSGVTFEAEGEGQHELETD